jgi:hypothetical protein
MNGRERIALTMQHKLPEALWQRVESFLGRLKEFPCWVDRNLSITVFGAKQNRDFWAQVFKTGKTPAGVGVLTKPLEIIEMIQEAGSGRGAAA